MSLKNWSIVGALIGAFIVAPVVVLLLWNAVVPGVFGLPTIDIWQALGLTILVRTLTGR